MNNFFSFLFKTITSWIDCFIEIISKKIKCNFIQFKFVCFLLLLIKDIQIRLTVDEWKTQWKRMMKETNRISNKNKMIDSNDINKKLIRRMKRSEWIKCFRDWWFQTDWSCSNFIISFLPFIEKCRIKNWQIKRKSLFYL